MTFMFASSILGVTCEEYDCCEIELDLMTNTEERRSKLISIGLGNPQQLKKHSKIKWLQVTKKINDMVHNSRIESKLI